MFRAPRWSVFPALAVVWMAWSTVVHAASFTASLDPNSIVLGEGATLTLTFDGGPPATIPVLPNIPNLDISSPPNRTSEFSFVNGVTSTIEKYTYTVTPTQPGEYTIPALTTQIGSQTVVSQPVKLTVLKQSVTSGPNNGDAQAFIRLVVPKQKVYVGEVIQAEFELCIREDVADIQNAQLTPVPAEGFTVGKSIRGQRSSTRVGNYNFAIVPVHMVFTAAKVGNLTLGPAACSLDLAARPLQLLRPAHPLPAYLAGLRPRQHPISPAARQHQPPGFNGAVGSYSLSVSASPTNIAVGDPITVTVQITGRGAVDSLTLPDQPGWQKFKLYPPTSDYQSCDPQLDLSGTKTFKLTAVPESMDITALPPFSFSFFDPEQNTYRTLTQPAIPLIVRPSAASLPPPTIADNSIASDNPQPRQDIMQIKPLLGRISSLQPPLIAPDPGSSPFKAFPCSSGWGSSFTAGSRTASPPTPASAASARSSKLSALASRTSAITPTPTNPGTSLPRSSICSRNVLANASISPPPPSPRPSWRNASFRSGRPNPRSPNCANCSKPATGPATRRKLPPRNSSRSFPMWKPRFMISRS